MKPNRDDERLFSECFQSVFRVRLEGASLKGVGRELEGESQE